MNQLTSQFFKGVSQYFNQPTRGDGVLWCPKHRIEHTAKNSYSIAIDHYLFQKTGDIKYFDNMKRRVERTLANLIRDPDYGHWMFYPGRLSKWNAANSMIDNGTCVDMLSDFYLSYKDRIDSDERRKIKEAIYNVSESYLKKAVKDKPITNQRLWGATGLSRAYAIFKKDEWRDSLLFSIDKTFSQMWSDGAFPYHPGWQKSGIFRGIYDITPYYHSRCVAFIYYILENLGEPIDRYRDQLIKSTDFLIAMYQLDGRKNIGLECKRWYWYSQYEVASSAYDIYTLIKTYELTNNEVYADYAKRAWQELLRHQCADGGIISHKSEPQNNFQCRIFWNSHLAWLTRVADKVSDLEEISTSEPLRHYQESGLVKFRNKNYSCIWRGGKQPMNVEWGPPLGGGCIVYLGNANKAGHNIFSLNPWSSRRPANFAISVKENFFLNLKTFIVDNKFAIKEELHHVLNRFRSFNIRSMIYLSTKLLAHIISGSRGVYTSHWASEVETSVSGSGPKFTLVPSKRSGQTLSGVNLKREYDLGENGILIRETLTVDNKHIKQIRYHRLSGAKEEIIKGAKPKQTRSDVWLWSGGDGRQKIEISYLLEDL